MKILLVLTILVILLPITCQAADRWYEGEESSSCDFACSMEKVVASASDGTAYMSQQEVSETAMKEMRIEQEQRASAFGPASMASYDSKGDAKTMSTLSTPGDAMLVNTSNTNMPMVTISGPTDQH